MDILVSFYRNFYNFNTNKIGIILKHRLPYSPYIMFVFLSFWVSIYHFFSQFLQIYQK